MNIDKANSVYRENDRYKVSFADMRGSKKHHYKIIREGIQMLPSVPHQEKYEKQDAYLSPSPNLQLQLREFPTEGDFVLKVKVAKLKASMPDAYVRAFLGERLDWGTDSKMFQDSVK